MRLLLFFALTFVLCTEYTLADNCDTGATQTNFPCVSCSENGTCSNTDEYGSCTCDFGYYGSNCSLTCPNNACTEFDFSSGTPIFLRKDNGEAILAIYNGNSLNEVWRGFGKQSVDKVFLFRRNNTLIAWQFYKQCTASTEFRETIFYQDGSPINSRIFYIGYPLSSYWNDIALTQDSNGNYYVTFLYYANVVTRSRRTYRVDTNSFTYLFEVSESDNEQTSSITGFEWNGFMATASFGVTQTWSDAIFPNRTSYSLAGGFLSALPGNASIVTMTYRGYTRLAYLGKNVQTNAISICVTRLVPSGGDPPYIVLVAESSNSLICRGSADYPGLGGDNYAFFSFRGGHFDLPLLMFINKDTGNYTIIFRGGWFARDIAGLPNITITGNIDPGIIGAYGVQDIFNSITPFTTGLITTSQLTSNQMTSGSPTTSRLTTSRLTTSVVTSGSVTSAALTSGVWVDPTSSSEAVSSSSTEESLKTGPIVGGAIGGVFVLALVGAIAIIILKRVKKSLTSEEELAEIVPPAAIHKHLEIKYSELSMREKIGEGNFGTVWRGDWRMTTVAVKQIKNLVDESAFEDFKAEAAIMTALRPHPNVVLFLGITVPPDPLCIVVEYCANGSLYSYIKDREIDEKFQFKVIIGIARGVLHLHHEKIVHRDLAARNILLGEDFVVKVGDFGLSKLMSKEVEEENMAVGPVKWMSPEALKEHKFSTASDVWSFGVVMWEVLSRKSPYFGLSPKDAARRVVFEGLRLPVEDHWHPIFRDIMLQCWENNPVSRPNLGTVIEALVKFQQTEEKVNEYTDLRTNHYMNNNNNSNNNNVGGYIATVSTLASSYTLVEHAE